MTDIHQAFAKYESTFSLVAAIAEISRWIRRITFSWEKHIVPDTQLLTVENRSIERGPDSFRNL